MTLPSSDRFERVVVWLDARSHGFAALLLAAVSLALYYQALSGWWTFDDPQHLKAAIRYSPGEYFFEPLLWQGYQGGFFTPLLTLSYDLDFSLFGINPSLFYVHQLVSVALAVFAFYLLLTLWVPRSLALAGAMLLLASPPLALAASWLAIRHYVEGLALASFALYAWVAALRRQRPALCWTSAVLYLLAMLAKEVYVPLAAIMLLLPERSWRERLRFSWPLLGVLGVYFAWRLWMLGGQFGGYGIFSTNWAAVPDVVVAAILLMPLTYFALLFGTGWVLPLGMGVVGALMVAWARVAPIKRLGFGLAMLVLISAPLVPVVSDLRPDAPAVAQRFVTVPAAAFVVVLVLGFARLGWQGKAQAVSFFILAAAGAGLWQQGHAVQKAWREPQVQKMEGEFLLAKRFETEALAVAFPYTDFYYRGISWLREYLGHGPAPATVYGGYFGLEPGQVSSQPAWRIYRYNAACECFRDATSAVLNERQKVVDRITEWPLHVRVTWGRGALSWDLGPYEKGTYFLLAGQQPGWYSSTRKVRRRGSLAYMLEGYMRAAYESPEGWIVLSPEFRVDLAGQGAFEWDDPGPLHANRH